MTKKLSKNQWKCLYCGNIIESKHQHHFISCKCGKTSIDGGTSYIRLVGDLDMMQDMSRYITYTRERYVSEYEIDNEKFINELKEYEMDKDDYY